MERVVSGGLDLESITDAEFSKLVGQQVTIFQAMLKRHQEKCRETGNGEVQPFCDEESEEALWAVKKHGRDSRSPSERDLTSPQLQVGWRSASNDACGMKARQDESRNWLRGDQAAEAQRNGSRANTAGLPGVGPRAVSEPQGVGATHSTHVLAAAEIRVEAWDIWPELFFEAVVEE
eukprot:g21235.t1